MQSVSVPPQQILIALSASEMVSKGGSEVPAIVCLVSFLS